MSTLPLIIRFTYSSLPDLPLSPSPSTTPLSLLHTHIRPHLPPTLSSRPLRLISRGALLPPTTPLATSLRLPPNHAQAQAQAEAGAGPGNGKQKASPQDPIYVHCSIGEGALPAAALAAERDAADAARVGLAASAEGQDHGGAALRRRNDMADPPPQGFDRLLSAGLAPAEIAGLRSQFLALQAHAHTPDTMPSPTSMRALEERWLDAGGGGGGGGADMGGGEEEGEGGALEDMLWGNVLGFFWAVGGAVWLMREEGVWSRRRRVAVATGVLANLAVGVWRVGG